MFQNPPVQDIGLNFPMGQEEKVNVPPQDCWSWLNESGGDAGDLDYVIPHSSDAPRGTGRDIDPNFESESGTSRNANA